MRGEWQQGVSERGGSPQPPGLRAGTSRFFSRHLRTPVGVRPSSARQGAAFRHGLSWQCQCLGDIRMWVPWVCSQSPGPCRQYSIPNGRWSVRVASVRVPARPGGRGELRALRARPAHRLLVADASVWWWWRLPWIGPCGVSEQHGGLARAAGLGWLDIWLCFDLLIQLLEAGEFSPCIGC
jgi:hypothetical protein